MAKPVRVVTDAAAVAVAGRPPRAIARAVYWHHIRAVRALEHVRGFQWDAGNDRKNADRHGLSRAEAEQVFFNAPLLVVADEQHSQQEGRFHALGRTDDDRLLHVTFTLRAQGSLIRVISARDMHRKERTRAMRRKLKPVPAFASEADERRFWESNDSGEHIDWTKAERVVLPNLRPSTTAISLRLPVPLLERIKVAANKRDVPYQSLIKMWLAEKAAEP
jgi:uncharacterized DUF497 family protein